MLQRLFFHIIEDALRGLSGPLGYRLRQVWYRRQLAQSGSNLRIEPGVHIIGADHIRLGDNVWLDRDVILIAGKPRSSARIVDGPAPAGFLEIGSDCHIGIQTIIQAHGGVSIGDCFTTSAGVKIYSFSNDPGECRSGTTEFGSNNPGYRVTPVNIGRNVWLGFDVLVIGGGISDDCFLRPQTVVIGEIEAGSVVAGPAAEWRRQRFPQEISRREKSS
jgi:acetyltransferase-like isoleucine patch superfamily enzyme